MKRKINLESDFDFFIGQVIGSVLVLNLKNNLMFRATSLAVKSKILDYLDQLSRTDAIKVLLIVSSAEKAGREEGYAVGYAEGQAQARTEIADLQARLRTILTKLTGGLLYVKGGALVFDFGIVILVSALILLLRTIGFHDGAVHREFGNEAC